MSTFGRTLFSPSPFVRWTLTPVFTCLAIFMPLGMSDWDATKIVIIVMIEVAALAMLAGFWLPERIGTAAFRLVAAIVFLAYSAYLIFACLDWMNGKVPLAGRKSDVSPLTALLGMVVIGLPSLVYAWKGRFTLREDPGMEAAMRHEYIKLLLQPDWQHCERLLGRPVPMALRELYADEKLVTASGLKFSDDCLISGFLPLQEQVMPDLNDDADFHPLLFASSVAGDPIYLVCGAEEDDCVYITLHDGEDTEVLADSMDEFVSCLREASEVPEDALSPAPSSARSR
ncbi:MAG: SMI1/KNR4 family protein [Verrucomicrobiaceae bacterium]|nr:SMI1/KNR4 family protein [Verrucomicrobiaceae bacterium]